MKTYENFKAIAMAETFFHSLPQDLIFKILSSLHERDVCALASCSKSWSELCGSDPIWVFLSKQRWPILNTTHLISTQWKNFYKKKHCEIAGRISEVVKFVEKSSTFISLEVRDYLKAIEDLCLMKLDYKDVEMFLFKPERNVLLNLIGLHYCMSWLGVPPENVIDALQCSKISEREVSIKWWKLGRWFHGFRLRDESHYRLVSLADLVTLEHREVLGILNRGAVYEVLRVQISIAHPLSPPWTCQSSVVHKYGPA